MNRAKIEDVLLKMGVPAGIKGFAYIADAVEYIDKHGTDIRITKDLYPDIAKARNTTASRVERAIRHAFSFCYEKKGDYETIEKYIGFTNRTNFSSLVRLHMKLKQECEEPQIEAEKKEVIEEPKTVITALEIREIVQQELRLALNELKEKAI